MIKEREQLLKKLLMAMDIFIVLVSCLLAYKLRENIHLLYNLDVFPGRQILGTLDTSPGYRYILPLLLFAWWAGLGYLGLYKSFRKMKFFEIVWGIVRSALLVMVFFATLVFFFKLDFVSRSLIIMSIFISCLLLITERWFIVSAVRFLRRKGYNYRNILIVGTGSRAKNFIRLVHRHSEWGLRIVGLIDAERQRLGRTVCGERVIGLFRDIPRILEKRVIDEVVFIVPRNWLSIIEKSLLACEIRGIKTSIAVDFFDMKIAHSVSSDIEGIPMVRFETTMGEEWQTCIKRLSDILLSLIGIVLMSPVFVVLVIMIKRLSPGPAIFKQVRSGLNGRKFVMYKLRTMVNGAEAGKKTIRHLNEMDGPVFKVSNDPRVTRFGKFLRLTSLDEIPQLFNVLKGDMSIVGPRPPLPSEVANYKIWQRRRLSMKPGLTCIWQTNGRNNVDFEKWMEMDLQYIDNWSLLLDFKLLLKTVPTVLFSVGAR